MVVKEGGYSNHFFAIEEGTRQGRARTASTSPTSARATSSASRACWRSRSARRRVTATSRLRVIKIEHWELSRMRKSMPEVVEELQRKVEERQG